MEVFFVYGLVLIFFVALVCIVFILMKEPAKDPGTNTSQQAASRGATSLTPSKIASYGLLAAIFALLFIISVATQRSRT